MIGVGIMGKYLCPVPDAIGMCLLMDGMWGIQFFYRNPAISRCLNLRFLVSTFLTANLFTPLVGVDP
jgi:hypothetical protein